MMEWFLLIAQGIFALLMALGGFVFTRMWKELDETKRDQRAMQESLQSQIKHTSDRVAMLNLTLAKDYPTRSDLTRIEDKMEKLATTMNEGFGRIFDEIRHSGNGDR